MKTDLKINMGIIIFIAIILKMSFIFYKVFHSSIKYSCLICFVFYYCHKMITLLDIFHHFSSNGSTLWQREYSSGSQEDRAIKHEGWSSAAKGWRKCNGERENPPGRLVRAAPLDGIYDHEGKRRRYRRLINVNYPQDTPSNTFGPVVLSRVGSPRAAKRRTELQY